MLSDGTVALIRGRDYRVEYRNPDGTWTSSAKLPFDWLHYAEEDKQKLVDSVKQANERQVATTYVAHDHSLGEHVRPEVSAQLQGPGRLSPTSRE